MRSLRWKLSTFGEVFKGKEKKIADQSVHLDKFPMNSATDMYRGKSSGQKSTAKSFLYASPQLFLRQIYDSDPRFFP